MITMSSFLSSATEIWGEANSELHHWSFYTFNPTGLFLKDFTNFASKWGVDAMQIEGTLGSIPDLKTKLIAADTEAITLALNETSTGVSFPADQIQELRQAYKDPLLFVDGVSAFPSLDLDFAQVDSAYFSVQKCFGLPAGLGVWIVNNRCVEKAEMKRASGHSIGAYQALPKPP